MISERDVRDRLAAVADRKLSLAEFGDWLEAASLNMHLDSSPGAIHLVSSIHLLFSEYEHGDLSESELQRRIFALAEEPLVLSIRVNIGLGSVNHMARSSRFGSTPWADVEVAVRVPA